VNSGFRIEIVGPDSWARVRAIRLDALSANPEAFGATHESESEIPESQWRDRLTSLNFVIAADASIDLGIMSVETHEGDFGTTCWIGGCWVRPDARGNGVMRALIDFIDQQSETRPWGCQGLGVWTDNYSAIATYERLGFVEMGDLQESTRQPGKFYQRMVRTTQQ